MRELVLEPFGGCRDTKALLPKGKIQSGRGDPGPSATSDRLTQV